MQRNFYDFLQEIVEACLEPIIITALYYRVKTSYTVLRRSLNIAIRFGLVNQSDEKYHTTPKGKDFLNAWKQVKTFLKEE